MEGERCVLAPLILKLASCEAEYIQNGCTRTDLERNVQDIRKEYENINIAPARRNRCYLAILLLFLERVKISLLLEDEIMEVIDVECSFFNDNIGNLMLNLKKSYENLRSQSDPESRSSADSSLKSKRTNYPKHVSHILRKWLQENIKNPYPTDTEKNILREQTGLDITQLNNWFINARRRILPFLRGGSPLKKK